MLYPNEDHNLLLDWFNYIGNNSKMYTEPLLDSSTVRFLKEVCKTFEQDTYVFILSIEIAETFIRAKNASKKRIKDPLLAAVTITYFSHKCTGAQESLKLKHVTDVLFFLSQRLYTADQVTAMEGDVLVTLQWKIPVLTTLDDLDVIIEKYSKETPLRANIRPLCLRLLEFLYIERKEWFKALKTTYNQNSDCLAVFEDLMRSSMYIPATILIAALQLSYYKHILNIDSILIDITKHTRIHADHINLSVTKILEILT